MGEQVRRWECSRARPSISPLLGRGLWSRTDEAKFAEDLQGEQLQKLRTEMQAQGVLSEVRAAAANKPDPAESAVDLSNSIAMSIAYARARFAPRPSQDKIYRDIALARYNKLRNEGIAEESDKSSDSDTDSDSDDGTTLKSHKYVPAIESDDEEIDQVEITIKNTKYILEGPNVYSIINNKKAQLYGTFTNGKVKKIQNKEIDV